MADPVLISYGILKALKRRLENDMDIEEAISSLMAEIEGTMESIEKSENAKPLLYQQIKDGDFCNENEDF